MVAPGFISITPSEGHPSGGFLVTIQGTDFQQHPDPPATGYVGGTFAPSMSVEFDGIAATNVRVYTTGMLTCLVPKFTGLPSLLTTGHLAEVTLINLGPPQEETATPDAFTYKRTNLARGDGILVRVVRNLILDIRRQVIDNVAMSTSVDYDSSSGDGLNIIELANAPGIGLMGPSLVESKEDRENDQSMNRNLGTLEYTKFREHRYFDIGFTAVIVGKDDPVELMNLMQELSTFFRNNTELTIYKDPNDESQGTASFDLWEVTPPRVIGTPNKDNLYSAQSEFIIQGVPLDDDSWKLIEWGKILGDPADIELQTEGFNP